MPGKGKRQKFTNAVIKKVREMKAKGKKTSDIAKKFSMSASYVRRIARNEHRKTV